MQVLEGNGDFSFQEMHLHFALSYYANKPFNFTLVILSNVILTNIIPPFRIFQHKQTYKEIGYGQQSVWISLSLFFLVT